MAVQPKAAKWYAVLDHVTGEVLAVARSAAEAGAARAGMGEGALIVECWVIPDGAEALVTPLTGERTRVDTDAVLPRETQEAAVRRFLATLGEYVRWEAGQAAPDAPEPVGIVARVYGERLEADFRAVLAVAR